MTFAAGLVLGVLATFGLIVLLGALWAKAHPDDPPAPLAQLDAAVDALGVHECLARLAEHGDLEPMTTVTVAGSMTVGAVIVCSSRPRAEALRLELLMAAARGGVLPTVEGAYL